MSFRQFGGIRRLPVNENVRSISLVSNNATIKNNLDICGNINMKGSFLDNISFTKDISVTGKLSTNDGIASGEYSVALGDHTEASGNYSTAMGFETKAIGNNSTTMGAMTIANGVNSFAIGVNTEAIGNSSVSMGAGTKSQNESSLTIGRFNDANSSEDTNDNYAFVIGNGEDENSLSDAVTIAFDGTTTIGGDLIVKGTILNYDDTGDSSTATTSLFTDSLRVPNITELKRVQTLT